MKLIALILSFIMILALAACDARPLVKSDFLLDTFVTITIYGGNSIILEESMALCRGYDDIFNRHNPKSELSRINASGGEEVKISPEMAEVIAAALEICEISDGAYDITIAPVLDLWDFKSGGAIIPPQDKIDETLKLVDYRNVILKGEAITLLGGASIDLGSIAKGFIADKIGEFLRWKGVKSAIINLGGDVLTVGGRPDGNPFHIGIQKPFSPGEMAETVMARDLTVISSGSYERYFELDGVLYHHIIDAKTGYPAMTDLLSVTVLSKSAALGDALSTYLFLLGFEGAKEEIEKFSGVSAVFIVTNGAVHLSYIV
jgi:thiamine biosynthesis lipoprotein